MAIIIIPARKDSTRLPNKLLLENTGKPLICHTVDRALESKLAQYIVVASEDQEILDAVTEDKAADNMGCRWRVLKCHTPKCKSGTERVAWTTIQSSLSITDGFENDADIIVNLQGDEPELSGEYLDALITALNNDKSADVATIASPLGKSHLKVPSVVKVVLTHDGNAMYFSRSAIPHNAESGLKHIGVYAYRREFLVALNSMEPTTLDCESLEQLQWLQSGFKIKVIIKDIKEVGIDTKREYESFVRRCRIRKKMNGKKNCDRCKKK